MQDEKKSSKEEKEKSSSSCSTTKKRGFLKRILGIGGKRGSSDEEKENESTTEFNKKAFMVKNVAEAFSRMRQLRLRNKPFEMFEETK